MGETTSQYISLSCFLSLYLSQKKKREREGDKKHKIHLGFSLGAVETSNGFQQAVAEMIFLKSPLPQLPHGAQFGVD